MKDWLNQFIISFGADAGEQPYQYRDQKDVAHDYNYNMNNWQNSEQNSQNNHNEEEVKEVGRSEETGENHEVKVKSLTKKLNKDKEKEWMERELTVTFTSLDEKDKVIHSNIDFLCGGRYSSLKSLPIDEIAQYFSKEYDRVFKYADASIANYSDMIDSRQALRLAKSVSEKSIISHIDYEKLCSKLNNNMIKEFDGLLAETKIRVAYPIIGMQKQAEVQTENYYINYIRDFKEYKTRDMEGLKKRVASFANQLSKEDVDGLLKEVVKDEVLKNIFQ